MTFLLDTNVISELRKPAGRSSDSVRQWAARQSLVDLYISVITVLEVELGVARVERRDPDQGAVLRRWLEHDLLGAFAGRVVPVDVAIARRAAGLHVPDPRPERDALIGATALVRGLTVATRNVSDFARLGVPLVDPWSEPRL